MQVDRHDDGIGPFRHPLLFHGGNSSMLVFRHIIAFAARAAPFLS